MTTKSDWVVLSDGKTFYTVTDITQDYHTKQGYFRAEDLKKKSGPITSSKGDEFLMFPARTHDKLHKMARHAQIIRAKDAGVIIAYTGITSDSIVIDSGSGSGALACRLGLVAKRVITYDIDERSLTTTKKNIELLGLKNVTVKEGSAYDGFSEKNVDVIILDLPEPYNAIDSAKKSLMSGGSLVSYSPNIAQCRQMVIDARKEGLVHERTIELIEREWVIDEMRCRPDFKGLGHTGFISFFRKA